MAAQNATTKPSVVHEDTVAMIHINFNESKSCLAKCQNGECIARLQNKKKIPKSVSIWPVLRNCLGIIQTLFANFEIVRELFPDYFCHTGDQEEFDDDTTGMNSLGLNDINIDDQIVNSISKENNWQLWYQHWLLEV